MRLTDSRYDRDRLRLTIAYRLIRHEARTHTIRDATGLSDDRIRKLFRDYFRDRPELQVKRRRGKSPRQMSFFRRSPQHELEAATLAAMLRQSGLLARANGGTRPSLEDVALLCDVYETFSGVCTGHTITLEHAWYLLQTLSREREFVLDHCQDCTSLWIRDQLDIVPYNCPACRMGLYAD
jgi:hypothetical protein